MLDYTRYLDKVYGCWLGKCIVGTVGAPYEGMKQLLHLEFDEKMIAAMLPNDDRDLHDGRRSRRRVLRKKHLLAGRVRLVQAELRPRHPAAVYGPL